MSKYIGRKVDLGMAVEGTRGEGTAPVFWVPKVDFSFDEKVVKPRLEGNIGTIEDSEEAFVTTKWGEGDVSGEVRSESFGLLLLALFGTTSPAGPADEAYTHSYSLQDDAQHDSLTFTVVDPNTTEQYRLVMLNSLEITQELDQVMKFSANFLGKTSVGASATADYTLAELKFTKRHLSFKLASLLAGLTAASAISLKTFNLTISNNVVLDDVLGTAEPEDILNQQFAVEGNFSLTYVDETYKEYMRANTKRALEISWINTESTLAAGATNPSLTIRMPIVDFFDWEPNYGLNEIVSQSISFKANRDAINGNDMISTCDLVNATVSY